MINSAHPRREYHSQEDKILSVNQTLTPFFCLANYIFINIIFKIAPMKTFDGLIMHYKASMAL